MSEILNRDPSLNSIDQKKNSRKPQVNHISFNQDGTCIALGLNEGYRIYNCEQLIPKCLQSRNDNSVALIEMFFRTSLFALVFLGEETGSLPRKLKLIHARKNASICDLMFPTAILAVKFSSKHMIVLLEDQIFIYDVISLTLVHKIETSPNLNRLCAISDDLPPGTAFLAYPSPPRTVTHDSLLVAGVNTNGGPNAAHNHVQSVSNTQNRLGDAIIYDLNTLQPIAVIGAHKSALAALCLSKDGNLLATASDKGTIVRVFEVHSGTKLFQFRRGSYPTRIYSLSFSENNQFLVATSSSGTVHVFRLGEDELLENKQKKKRYLRTKRFPSPSDYDIIEEIANDDATSADALQGADENDLDVLEDDGDDSDAEAESKDGFDENYPTPYGHRKLSQGSTHSVNSLNSGVSSGGEDLRDKSEPVIDQSRLSVARLIRRSSQTLGRKAAQKMGDFLPSRFSSILEPTRHFASLKFQTSSKDVKAVAMLKISENDVRASTDDSSQTHAMYVNVVTSEGIFFVYSLDAERGGDCILLHQYALIEEKN